MSFLLGFGQSFLSGLSSISSGIVSSLSSIASDINNSIGIMSNFFQQLPSNIQSFFQTVAGALIAFGHTFGTYILNGLQWIGNAISSAMVPVERGLGTLGSAILNALTTLWNDLKAFASDVYNWIMSAISNVVGVVQGIINDLKNTAVNVYNFLVNIVNDIYNAFTYVYNAIFNLPQFFGYVAEYFNSLFGGSGGSNLLNVVPSIIASEASRIASALPDVVAYNTFMEMMPKMVYGIANSPYFGNGIQGMFSKAMLMMMSPILSGFIAMFTKSFMDNLFTPARTTQTVSRPTTPQLQSFTALPSSQLQQRSATTTSVSDVGQLSTSNLTPNQIELELEQPNVSGVFVEDVIGMGTPNGGTAELLNYFVIFGEVVEKVLNVLWSLFGLSTQGSGQSTSSSSSSGTTITQSFSDWIGIALNFTMQVQQSSSSSSSGSSGQSSSGQPQSSGTTITQSFSDWIGIALNFTVIPRY